MEAAHGHAHDHHDAHAHHPGGIMRWITTTNHKDIGTMYLWFSFIMFITGGVMALTIRAELFSPGLQIVQPEMFNQAFLEFFRDGKVSWKTAWWSGVSLRKPINPACVEEPAGGFPAADPGLYDSLEKMRAGLKAIVQPSAVRGWKRCHRGVSAWPGDGGWPPHGSRLRRAILGTNT